MVLGPRGEEGGGGVWFFLVRKGAMVLSVHVCCEVCSERGWLAGMSFQGVVVVFGMIERLGVWC